jgi:hypothetical protein
VADLATATSRSLKLKLLDPSEASFTVEGHSIEAGIIEELISDLWVYRDGVPMFRGRVTGPVHDKLSVGGDHETSVEVRDYRYVLDRRIRWANRTWTTIEQSTIAWDAISDTSPGETGGDLRLTKGTWPTTGVVRPSVVIEEGDTVWSFLKRLAAMSDGFEFDIDMTMHANLYYPHRGVTTPVAVLDYGGLISEVDRSFDPAQYANAIDQTGADGVAHYFASDPAIGTVPQGRWDATYSDTQLTTADMVGKVALSNLAQASLVLPSYSLTLAKNAWRGLTHVGLGDYVTVVVKSGRLLDVVQVRVFEIDISIDSSDQEAVTLVCGDVTISPRSVLRGIAKRVNQLAKR